MASLLFIILIILVGLKEANAFGDVVGEGAMKEFAKGLRDSVHELVCYTDKIISKILNGTIPVAKATIKSIEDVTDKVTNCASKNIDKVADSMDKIGDKFVKIVEISSSTGMHIVSALSDSMEKIGDKFVKIVKISSSTGIHIVSALSDAFKNGRFILTIDPIGPNSRDAIIIISIAASVTITLCVFITQSKHILPLLMDNQPKKASKKAAKKDTKTDKDGCNGDDNGSDEQKKEVLEEEEDENSSQYTNKSGITDLTYTTVAMPDSGSNHDSVADPNMAM